jgi:LacI family transcriptional regulator
MTTVKDVARKAGVSTATVSRVINGTHFVSEELRARVYQTMREIDYRPNAIARSLRCKETRNIALVVPDIAYPFVAEVAKGVEDEVFKVGYSAILCESQGNEERECACIRLLLTKQVDGIVFVASGESPSYIQALVEQRVPVVVCGRDLPDVAVDTVITDNAGSGYQATEYLIRSGHHRVGCIVGPPGLGISDGRENGYRRALEECGIPWEAVLTARGDFRCRGGYDAMRELLALDDRPTAVFACNDLMAMGAICAASKCGLRVPQDLAIIGCDDIALASFTNPSLTTVAHPKREMGRVAVDMLVRRIENRGMRPTKRVLPTELVIRDSG